MTFQNSRGEVLSTVHAASAAAYDHTLDLFNSFRTDPVAALAPVLAEDPDFISGHLLMAGMMLSTFDPQLLAPARASLDLAKASALTPTAREQSLHAALRVWAEGNYDAGNRRFDRHLVDHPRDLFALQFAHLGDLVVGRTTMLRDRIARVLGRWSERDAGYGYVLGMQAFGYEENFDFAQAEDLGRRAVSLQPHDAWAIHAVAHVCEMQGRPDNGIRWMNETRRHWSTNNALAVHNHWHLALMHLANGDHGAALALYDQAVAPSPQALALDLADASALLWRLYLRGVDAGARWTALAQRWQQQYVPGQIAFHDVHAAIAFAAAGDDANAAALTRLVNDASTRIGADEASRHVAVPACAAVAALVAGDSARCTALLLPLLPVAHVMGGSHAQRSLLLLTAQEAANRGGDLALAGALEAERRVHRSSRQLNHGKSRGAPAGSLVPTGVAPKMPMTSSGIGPTLKI